MKAVIGDVVVAEAPADQLISIEGNWYFPPSSITPGVLTESPTPYHCPWKGDCQYFDVAGPDGPAKDNAWAYPSPLPGAAERVGQDFTDYVAFWKDVKVTD